MKIKTKDKIAFLVKSSNEKASYWKRFKKDRPRDFDNVYERAKKGDTISVNDGVLKVKSNLPDFSGVDFSKFSIEEKQQHEAFIKKTSFELFKYIKKFNFIGACMTIPYFYKLFLESHNIPIDAEYGIFELHGRFSSHSWNKYDGKIIDITANFQKEGVCGSAIVMGDVIEAGKDELVYHRVDQLPKRYTNFIEEIALLENRLLDSKASGDELAYFKEMLDTDAFLCRALRINMNSIETIKSHLLQDNNEEYQHFQDNFTSIFLKSS